MKNTSIIFKHLCVLVFLAIPFWAYSQTITVTGVVNDTSGEPILGATIVQVGATTNGVITDFDGNFAINVPSQSSIQVSYIGYQSQVIEVGGRTRINVTLDEDTQALEEVVVIGYGTQRRSDVTGSITSVNTEVVREMPASNISQALQGRVAGMEMSSVSSKPGAAMQIRIRGQRSLNASNDPLIVLDGIPFAGSIADIEPNTIRSVDILKDASSTAIYGSRGANGVILISTIRGTQDTKATISYNGYYGIKDVFARYPMMNGAEFAELRRTAGIYSNTLDENDGVNTDWQDLFYKTGVTTSHNVNVAGGTKEGTYSFDITGYQDEALVPGSNYNRITLRGTFDQGIGKYFRIGVTTNNNYNVTNDGAGSMYNILSLSPLASPYNEDGTWKRTIKMPLDESINTTRGIVENLGDGHKNQRRGYNSYNSLYSEVKIPWVDGLKYRINLGLNYRNVNAHSFTGEGVLNVNETTESNATVRNELTTNWAVENLISYDKTFKGKHQVNVVGMYSAEESQYNQSHMRRRGVPDHMQFWNLGQSSGEMTIAPGEQKYHKVGLISYMGRAMYSYDNRYMVSATVRSDASSRLAEGYKWHTYPAVSVGWNMTRESFMSNIEYLDMLKLRVGYGQTSNQSVDPYKTLGLLSTRPYNFGDYFDEGFYVSELPNAALGWEFSETWNYGIDFSFLNSRISGTMEYYIQNTNDILLSVGLPQTSGVGSYMANIGKSQNKGFELSLNGIILDNYNGFTWDAGVNMYMNRNKLVALASGQEEDRGNRWFVGHPINVIYDYEKIGLWQEGDPHLNVLEPGGNVGMIKVKYTGGYDENGVPLRRINDDDRQIMNVEPDAQGGFNTRIGYKGFDLSVVGAYKIGGTLVSTLYSATGYLNMMSGRRGNVQVDYWTPENTGAKYPKPGGLMSGDNPKYGTSLGYFDATYVKIRTISLGYDFKQDWMKKAGIQRLRLYGTIQNPFVIYSPYTKETGGDPETNSYGDENVAVTERELRRVLTIGTGSPSTRNFLVGINVTF